MDTISTPEGGHDTAAALDSAARAKLAAKRSEWGAIAQDIVMMSTDSGGAATYTADDVADNYGLTPDELNLLLTLPAMKELIAAEKARIHDLGVNAGARIRAEALASSLQETLYRRALNGQMDDRQAVQLLSILMRSAGTDAPPETKEAERSQTQVNIAFNIPKIAGKKFAKLSACAQNKVVEPSEGTE